MQLFRHLLGQVVRLAPVFIGVVELPGVVVECRGFLARDYEPRRLVPRHRGPALVVDAAVAEHLEVLCLMLLGRLGIVERVRHADAFDRMLLDSVDEGRLGQAGHFKDGWRNVDHVMELGADFALPLDSLGPVHDRSVARAAPMRGDLLGPLVRSIHGVRPAHGIVVVRFRPAELVQPRHQELGRLQCGRAVEIDHLVVCAIAACPQRTRHCRR